MTNPVSLATESSMSARILPFVNRCVRRLFVAVLLLCVPATIVWAGDGQSRPAHAKLDDQLRAVVGRGADSAPQRVIIRVKPGAADDVKALLRTRGDKALRFHAGINAFTASVRNLAALAKDDRIASVSADAPLHAHQLATTLPTQQIQILR